MHATAHAHHELPRRGSELTSLAILATLHCLTGCAIGEITGMVVGTSLGLSNGATIAISVTLAFLFGYGLTSLPLLRAGLALSAVVPIALASDTFSIAIMEIVDNTTLFWGSLTFALAFAFVAAVPVNRWLIARGRGHAVVHSTGV